jgi:hypothetical protein
MIKDDYIIRMIEQFGEILRKILTYEDEGDYAKGHAEIDTALKKLGVSEMFCKTLPTDSLVEFVRRPGQNNAKRLLMLSRLVGTDAHIYNEQGDRHTAHDLFRTSLEILSHAKDDADNDDELEIDKDAESIRYYITENIRDDSQTETE